MNGDSSGPSSISLCEGLCPEAFAAGLLTAGVLILLVLAHPNEEGNGTREAFRKIAFAENIGSLD